MAPPTVLGVGVAASGTGAITPAFPTGFTFQDGDLIVGVGESAGAQTYPTAASNGFAHVTGSPITQDTQTVLTVIWRRWTAGLTAHSWGDSGDHNVGRYIAIRGVRSTGNPWGAVTPVVATESVADTSATWSAITTQAADCLVLFAIATGRDLATTANLGAMTGGTGLTSITERMDDWVASGTGGGIGLVTAIKAAIGATGTPGATMGSTDTKALMTLALEPEAGVALTASGASTSGGAATLSLAQALTASGTSTSSGTAGLSLAAALSASGQTASGGAATLSLAVALTALGQTASGGAATLSLAVALTASGQTASGGTAALGLTLPPLATNTLEGITPGANVTPANSGGASGTAADAITATATASVTAVADPAHGNVALQVATGATPGEAYWTWIPAGGPYATLYPRAYLKLPAAPSATARLFRWLSASTVRGSVGINTARQLLIANAAGTTIATMTTAIPTGSYVRVEARCTGDPTAGVLECKLWLNANMDSPGPPDETITATAQNTGGTIERVRYGPTGTTIANFTEILDDLAVADAGYPGPVVAPPTTASGTTSSGGTATLTLGAALSASGQTASGGSATLSGLLPLTASGQTTSGGAVTVVLPGVPDAILASTNLTGSLAAIQDNPTSPDGAWLTATAADQPTDVRVSFPTPTQAPGSGGQPAFRLWLRRTAGTNALTNPVAVAELWEGGSFRRTLGVYPISSTSGQLIEAPFDPADLTDPTGAGVECRVRVQEDDLLARKDLIYSSEIGAWREDGAPAVDPATPIPAKARAAAIPLVRFALHDTFTDLLDPSGAAGTISRADFRDAMTGITQELRSIPWLKCLPIAKGVIGTKDGTVWCPPWTGTIPAVWLNTYKAMLDELRSVYAGPVVIESNNEMEYSCWETWRDRDGASLTGAGNAGVSTRLGQHYAQTMGALRRYARDTLGFEQVVIGGYLGVSGGPGWGQTPTVDGAKPYGYSFSFTFPNAKIDEFNNAVKSAYDAAPAAEKADLVPDFLAVHAYPHSGDFSTSATGYEFTDLTGYDGARPDDIAYSFYRQWLTNARSRCVAVWGSDIGNRILLSISEWSAGLSSTGATWSGWTTAGRPAAFFQGWLTMLRGDGTMTGSGTRYWNANCFLLASESDSGDSRYYNLVRMDGTTPIWYDTFKALATNDPNR